MGAGAAVVAWDVVFNREVADDAGRYVRDPGDVAREVEAAEADPEGALARGKAGQEAVAERYRWDDVAAAYEALAVELVERDGADAGAPLRRAARGVSRPRARPERP